MNCKDTQKRLDAYIDAELDSQQESAISQHLQNCNDCQKVFDSIKAVSQRLQSNGLQYVAPKGLQKRLSASLHENEKASTSWFSFPSALAYSLPALLLGALIGGSFFSLNRDLSSANSKQEMLVASHVRSLMADHLLDIASSDSHSVKPWFDGRLNFSPEVQDLTRQGFPLSGGRLDYLSGKTVAALVYRHRKHTINLFIYPDTSTPTLQRSGHYKSYNIVQWNHEGFHYSLVSNLNLKDLEKLKILLLNKGHL